MAFQFESDHRAYLQKEFRQRMERRPLYSQRAFARDLGLSPSSLGDYFREKIRLSPGRISQIAKKIGLSAEQKQHWIDLVEEKFARSLDVRAVASLRVKSRLQAQNHSLTLDQFKVVSEWFHFAYLELLDMDSVKYSDLKVAATALGIPLKTLKVAVTRLEKVGLVKKNDSKIYQVDPSTRVGDELPSEAIRQYHSQLLKKAMVALENQDMSRRFSSSTMIALPTEQVPRILENLRSLALQFLDPYVQNIAHSKEELYCLSIQFFDLLEKKV